MPPDVDPVQSMGLRDLPTAFERFRLVLASGDRRRTDPADWTGCLVVVERGTVEVECGAGGSRSFRTGDMVALDWLPLLSLHNPGTGEACLLAVRRRGESAAISETPNRRFDRMTFRTVIELGGKTATGFRVPDEVVAALGAGKRPAVLVRIGSYSYRSTVAVMDGAFMLPLSAEHREAAGLAAGEEVEVTLELDTAPRDVVVPEDFTAALDADPEARRTFDALSYSNKRFHVEPITGARTDETRQRRIEKSVRLLHEGRAR